MLRIVASRALRSRQRSLRPARAFSQQVGPAAVTASAPGVGSFHVSTTSTIPGFDINKHYGYVQGSTVRSRHAGQDILATFKMLMGGEISMYTELLNASREEAMGRMQRDAVAKGANGVIGLRVATTSVAAGTTEMFIYATAVSATSAVPGLHAAVLQAHTGQQTLVTGTAVRVGATATEHS